MKKGDSVSFETNFLCEPDALAGLDPTRTAHLCIDLQDGYFHPENTNASEEAKENGPVVAERIARVAPLFNDAGLNSTLWVWHEVVGEKFYLVDPPEEERFAKKHYSAFRKTSLDKILKLRRVDTLVLSGGYTSFCVRNTARDGLANAYRVLVLTDCVQDFYKPLPDKDLKEAFTKTVNGEKKRAGFTTSGRLLEHLKSYARPQPVGMIATA